MKLVSSTHSFILIVEHKPYMPVVITKMTFVDIVYFSAPFWRSVNGSSCLIHLALIRYLISWFCESHSCEVYLHRQLHHILDLDPNLFSVGFSSRPSFWCCPSHCPTPSLFYILRHLRNHPKIWRTQNMFNSVLFYFPNLILLCNFHYQYITLFKES